MQSETVEMAAIAVIRREQQSYIELLAMLCVVVDDHQYEQVDIGQFVDEILCCELAEKPFLYLRLFQSGGVTQSVISSNRIKHLKHLIQCFSQ